VQRLARLVVTAFSNLVAIAAPERCAACDESTSVGSLFCAVCEQLAPGLAERVTLSDGTPVVALGTYGGPLREAIRHLKYGNRPDLARPFGERLARAADAGMLPPDAVFVPVPLHRKRLAERGYNQSALVAAVVAGRLGRKSTARALVRTRVTAEQANLLRADRLRNVAGAFETIATFHGRSVVLVDDVVTTGATVHACIRALESARNRVIAVAALGVRTRDQPTLEKRG
jgi:ComF family protein